MKNKVQTYSITGAFKMECEVDIEAQSWEDALKKAKELRELDFVKVLGQYVDGEYLGIRTIYTNDTL